MASFDSTDVAKILTGKLKCEEDRKKDHIVFLLADDSGTFIAQTKISHGPKHTIGAGLVTQMAKQLGLGTAGKFSDLVSCSLDRVQCLQIIKQNRA